MRLTVKHIVPSLIIVSFFIASTSLATSFNAVYNFQSDAEYEIYWGRRYPSAFNNIGRSVVSCESGGYAVIGEFGTIGTFNQHTWLIRTDSGGIELWNRTYEISTSDWGNDLVECSNGDFVFIVQRPSGDDCYVTRTDSNGNELWTYRYSYYYFSHGISIVECNDGGFAIVGQVWDPDGLDVWLLRLDSNGVALWNETYGESEDELGWSLVECSDGGFALGCELVGGIGIIRTDQNGAHLWNYSYGGSSKTDIIECSEGGFALVGRIMSGSYSDMYLVRVSSTGSRLWDKRYGGDIAEAARSLVECSQTGSGFALAGFTNSFGAGAQDMWLVRTDLDGNQLWNITYGGSDHENCYSLIETANGFVMSGYTRSFGAHGEDVLIVGVGEEIGSNGYIPGFPIEAILTGIVLILLPLLIWRRKYRRKGKW